MRQFVFLFSLMLSCGPFVSVQKATISILDSGRNVSLRGLSVVNDTVVWCSGSKGSIAKSIDGGKTFEWITVTGYDTRDFRDIEAFDANTALIMGVAEPAIILKTVDGGKTWKKVFEDSTKGMFLDAMVFDKKGVGHVIGDPIAHKIFHAFSYDFGNSWIGFTAHQLEKGEAFFASSGSNIQHRGKRRNPYVWVSGGSQSHLFYKGKNYKIPMTMGKESTGANSIAVRKKKAIIVGGDFTNDKSPDSNCILVNFRKKPEFSIPQNAPSGYRSCVIYLNKKLLLCCGTSGIDISIDGGKNWKNVSNQSFHVIQKSKTGTKVYLAGPKGKVGILNLAE